MNLNSPHPAKDLKERKNSSIEIVNAEKQLWASVHCKGLLHADVQDMFHKVRSAYEKIILSDHEPVEFQDVEYSLWKLHYKHIDEFRKRIRQNVGDVRNNLDSQFSLFLSDATKFYNDLIVKLRKCWGLNEEPLFRKRDGFSISVKPEILHKCRSSCHHFLVCLGDLARYRELCKKPDFQPVNWSVAAGNYFKATMIWPGGGNPHNQLALLATYVHDDVLALYHCVRSLAVEEPFPDARDNLILLLEKNRSYPLPSLTEGTEFDFLNPSNRIIELRSNGNWLEATEQISSGESDFWSLFIRMISFFFLESSLEHFSCTLASTVRELEILVMLDDTKLEAKLESYEHLDSARKGPYRALQTVSVLIFAIHNSLKQSSETKEKNNDQQHQLAWTAAFIFIGRLLERCLKNNNIPDFNPVLSAVLVFVEWLASMINEAEMCGTDEKFLRARSYFFATFVEVLNRIQINEERAMNSPYRTALWEDQELRGFAPVARTHASLDFDAQRDNTSDVKYRAHRVFGAGMKFVERSKDSQKWIFYDKSKRKFYTPNSMKYRDDDEEVILFKPITRYNSTPICTSTEDDFDECLRRASSLYEGQSQTVYRAGPPSLNAWVVNEESVKNEKDLSKIVLSPINEYSEDLYVSPVPSAPLIPEDATWFSGNPSRQAPMSSSEWLYHYRNNQIPGRVISPLQPIHFYAPSNLGYFDVSTNHQMVYEERRENLSFGYQRPSPYVCRAGTELRAENEKAPVLLQYLKEREVQLQRESHMRGHAYMGN